MSDKALYVMAGYDDNTENYLANIQNKLYERGFIGTHTKNIPQHITLGSFSIDKESELKNLLQEVYEKRSATLWADEIKCPILIIHSELDEKVSYKQAEKMVEALKDAGKEYKFISYEDNIHGLHPEDFSIIMEWCQ